MIQADSNRSDNEAHEDAEFFIQLVPNLDNRISAMVQQLKKPLTYIFPVDFQAHLQYAKSIDRIDQDWLENFKDVAALKIQGRINLPLIRLAQQLRAEFGGQSIFWLDVLCSYAQNEKYHQNLRIWQINDAYKACLHLPIGEYEKNRHFRRLAKQDINLTRKLITSINELVSVKQNQEGSKKAPGDILTKVQQNYKVYQESSRKVVQFLRNQKVKCLQFFDQNNLLYPVKSQVSEVSNSNSKRTKEKDRQIIPKQKMITDFSVQMVDPKNTQFFKKITGKEQKPVQPQKVFELDRLFSNIADSTSETKPNLPSLRNQFMQTKSKLLTRPQSTYINIHISYSYIQYQQFPNLIEQCPFKYFDDPFQQSKDVYYDIDDYELFEEYEADAISSSDSEENSDDDELDSNEKRYFYNEDDDGGYDFDEEDRLVHNTAFRKTKLFEGSQWILNYKEENPFWINLKIAQSDRYEQNSKSNAVSYGSHSIPNSSRIKQIMNQFDAKIICLEQTPMIVFSDGKMSKQDQLKIQKIFHGRSKQQAMDIINEDDDLAVRFTKDQIRQVTSKMTKKRVKYQEGKWALYYFINENNKENQSKDQNIQKVSSVVKDQDDDSQKEFDQPQTAFEDQDYMPGKGFSVNVESRSSSQRINNIKSISLKSKQQQKSQSSSLSNQSASVTGSNPISQKSKKEFLRESKLWSQQTITNPPDSRLRPRISKPNYNLEKILNGSQNNDDVQI